MRTAGLRFCLLVLLEVACHSSSPALLAVSLRAGVGRRDVELCVTARIAGVLCEGPLAAATASSSSESSESSLSSS